MEAATARKYVSSRIRNLEEEDILFHLRFKYVLINQTIYLILHIMKQIFIVSEHFVRSKLTFIPPSSMQNCKSNRKD